MVTRSKHWFNWASGLHIILIASSKRVTKRVNRRRTLNTQTDERRAFVKAIMNRLWRQYAERTPLPDRDDAETPSVALLQRLYRYVMSEGYGE